LTDQDDAHCPPLMIAQWFGKEPLNKFMNFRIATTEAEVWLMADRINFSRWLKVDVEDIPEAVPIHKKTKYSELSFPIKPSLYLMMKLAPKSKNIPLRDQLIPRDLARKGPAYNSALLPFIEYVWSPEAARKNSTSLDKAINRLIEFNP